MIVFDTSALIVLLDPLSSQSPPAPRAAERVAHFVDAPPAGMEFGIPAPVVAEFVASSNHDERVAAILDLLQQKRIFRVLEFGPRVAIETGRLTRRERNRSAGGDASPVPRGEIKFDAMIAATSLAYRADALLSGDGGFERWLAGTAVRLVRIKDLSLPPEDPQGKLL